MPKLNALDKLDRISAQLAKLVAGQDVAARDMRALLTEEQRNALDNAWQEQQALRKRTRARTEQEKRELGWKTKREVQIEVLKQAIQSADDNLLDELEKQLQSKERRAAAIYLEAYFQAKDEEKTDWQAQAAANNALTRAHLLPLKDRPINNVHKQGRAVEQIEQRIRDMLRAEMTEDERRLDDERREYEKKGE